ncbi:MAG: Ltp family lipoprotein [Lachnospiraceae bacterium]|nr:Ltp family lipoprotein [Lachnospiraceae bacterium]
MRKIVFVIAVFVLVTVSVCGCGDSGKGSSDDKSEKKAPPIGVIDVNKPSGDYNIEDKTVSSVTPAASDEPAAALDQLYNYVESPEFMDNVSLPDMPERDLDLSGMTLSQQNAVKTAMNYVDLMAFSRRGLVEQISSEYADNFPVADAEFAVKYLEDKGLVDWNEEAAQCAQNYLDIMSFSRDGLYQQMTSESGDKFTKEQAEYALSQVGY